MFAVIQHHARSPLLMITMALVGVCSMLGLYQLWLAGGKRHRRMHQWIAAWCFLSCLTVLFQFLQFSSPEPREAGLCVRAYVGLYAWMPLFLLEALHAIRGTELARLERIAFWVIGIVTGCLLAFTDLIFTNQWSSATHIFGHRYYWVYAGPVFAPVFIGIVFGSFVNALVLLRSSAIHTKVRRALFVALCLCGILAFQGVLAGLELLPYSLFALAFPVVSAAFTYVAVIRYRLLQEQLEELVSEQTEELEEKNRSLDVALREATAATIAKSRFLANMSHELRTPMNGVLGMTQLLYESSTGSEERQLLDAIQHSGETLLALLNDILDFSKIEAGQLELQERPFSIAQLLENTTRLLGVLATQKNLSLTWEVDGDVPKACSGDNLRLQQILLNLTTNAIKFTSSGGVDLRAALVSRDGEMARVLLTVRDSGEGIPPHEQARIFESFTQSERAMQHASAGAGLGLAISKELTNLMGGTIDVKSTLGEGATFSVCVPLLIVPGDSLPKTRRIITQELAFLVRVLIVEDNVINQRVAQQMLQKLGCESKVATHGEEALVYLAEERFDMVLMDCLMPVMNGFDATLAIREREETEGLPRIPIVAMTANALEGDRERCLAVGMDDYIAKPMTLKLLRATIVRWCDGPVQ